LADSDDPDANAYRKSHGSKTAKLDDDESIDDDDDDDAPDALLCRVPTSEFR
jgi:hypothetical protein